MKQHTRITINEAKATDQGILITSCSVIDGDTGKVLRIAKLTPELAELFTKIEIDTDIYFLMQKQNIKQLINTFNLVS